MSALSDVVMPRLSDSMEEGTIVRWLKRAGEPVARGEELVEIETDKATMTYEADRDGVLEIVAPEGATLPIGEVIAHIGLARAPASTADGAGAGAGAGAHVTASPADDGGGGGEREQESASDGGDRVKAAPVARRVARERGLDLAAVAGTGPGGRIVRADVEGLRAAPPTAPPTPAPAPAPAAPAVPAAVPAAPPPGAPAPPPMSEIGAAKGEVTVQEPSRAQQVVARRMAHAKATVPEFTLTVEIDMDRAVDLRAQLKAIAGEQPAPSFNDMVVRACALALREYPRANGSYRDGHFELYSRVNVGVAVATQDSLVVPTVFDADAKSLARIASETRALAERVRAGTITPPELSGGTFTVSNLGMYAIHSFTAVINAPQAAILAVGAVRAAPVVRDGRVTAGHLMPVTLACDHRILYGAEAARFLGRVRELLELPVALTQ